MRSWGALKIVGLLFLSLSGTAAFSALSLPPPRLAPTSISSTATTSHTRLERAAAGRGGAPLQMSMLGRAFRRVKGRLRTMDKEKTSAKRKRETERPWRVMFHNSEYLPDGVARVLSQVLPISRATAFEVCLRARSEGTVAVMVTDKKNAERFCGALQRRGLTATIEPYEAT